MLVDSSKRKMMVLIQLWILKKKRKILQFNKFRQVKEKTLLIINQTHQ